MGKYLVMNSSRPNNIGAEIDAKEQAEIILAIEKAGKVFDYGSTFAFTLIDTTFGIDENIENRESKKKLCPMLR